MGGGFLSIGECMVELSQADGGLLRKGFAGDTLNTAWYARASFPADWTVDYFTAVGDDALSEEMIDFIAANGIGTSHIRRIGGASPGLYLIALKQGERSFSYWRDSSAARQLAADPSRLRHAIEASSVVYFSGITLGILENGDVKALLAEIRRARAAGKIVAFDQNIRPRLWKNPDLMRDVLTEAARASTIVMPSFDDESTHFGDGSIEETIQRYTAIGVDTVVVKDGARGATIATRDRTVFIPAEPVDTVIDTTGAGDSFNGAFLSQYCLGSVPINRVHLIGGV